MCITVDTAEDPPQTWLQGLTTHNWDPSDYTVIGAGVKWNGWKTRTGLLLSWLALNPDAQYFLVTDGRDVIINASKETIWNKYIGTGKDILFGAESRGGKQPTPGINLHPFTLFQGNVGPSLRDTLHIPSHIDLDHNNHGMFIGTRESIIDMLTFVLDNSVDDQFGSAMWLVQQHKFKAGIDFDRELFFNINKHHSLKAYHTYVQKRQGQTPCVIHCPGNGFRVYNIIMKELYEEQQFIPMERKASSSAKSTAEEYYILFIVAFIVTFIVTLVVIMVLAIMLVKKNKKTGF